MAPQWWLGPLPEDEESENGESQGKYGGAHTHDGDETERAHWLGDGRVSGDSGAVPHHQTGKVGEVVARTGGLSRLQPHQFTTILHPVPSPT